MKQAIIELAGVTPYSPSRHYAAEVARLKDEDHEQYDERTWRHHAHLNSKASAVIPGECFAWSFKAASKRRSDKIAGKRGQTYTKVFDALEVMGSIDTGVSFDNLQMESFMANSDGTRGSGKRVLRRFPIIRKWSGSLTVIMWDDQMREDVFSETIRDAGLLVGVGRRRPENKGTFGRFQVTNINWLDRVEIDIAMLASAE